MPVKFVKATDRILGTGRRWRNSWGFQILSSWGQAEGARAQRFLHYILRCFLAHEQDF
jgi:hypothetical protein